MEKTSKAKELKEKLFLKRKNTYEEMTEEEIEKAEEFCEGYKEFLDAAKTEREACNEAEELLKAMDLRLLIRA